VDFAKPNTQFIVAVIAALALSGLLAVSIYRGDRDITLMLAGGLISLTTASSSWLFKNGNSNGTAEK